MKRKIILTVISVLGVFLVAGSIALASTTTPENMPIFQQPNETKFNAGDEDYNNCYSGNNHISSRHHRSQFFNN